jgi:hypothetical protein
VSECDREASTMRRPWPTVGCRAMGKNIFNNIYGNINMATVRKFSSAFDLMENIKCWRWPLRSWCGNVEILKYCFKSLVSNMATVRYV